MNEASAGRESGSSQRRGAVRVAVSLPVRFAVAEPDSLDPGPDAFWIPGRTLDLSASGCRFVSPVRLHGGSRLHFTLQLSEQLRIVCIARVVRVVVPEETDPASPGARPAYDVAVEFELLESLDRDAIFRFVFNEERRRIQMGIHD